MTKHEYAFDIKMFAVVRIRANTKTRARDALMRALDAASLDVALAEEDGDLAITSTSISVDDELGPYLLEIDGEDVD